MYSLGRVSVCLLEMGLLRPGVVLTLFIAQHSLGTLFSSFPNSSERVTMIFFILWMKKPKPPPKFNSLHGYRPARPGLKYEELCLAVSLGVSQHEELLAAR